MPIAGVIFDMDGLVIDTEAGYGLAWRQAASAMGYVLDEAVCAALSGANGAMVKAAICHHLGADLAWSQFARLSGEHWRRHVEQVGIPVKPGFFELIGVLQGANLPFGLATNSRRAEAEFCLQRAGLADVFPITITRDDVAQPKPAPDVFVEAAKRLALKPSHCLVLEDSLVGVDAARAAGCACVWVPSQPVAASWLLPQDVRLCDDLHQVAGFISAAWAVSL
ncbi:MAG: haloacid dehalogenase [Methylomonas sp.]|nr:MAG: haloacid dehalogenase [Methylomonas sp.]PPD24879.1 MAG: haloacid dehalogenase [Methylomonas sp.]PPD33748.1 MAG: haloacid dehalogenase [Methylomonas sp.]PPD40543.1 MAG: haloacid dehalogenase [Methylomonas sp.]PPD55218.1 MAG: haloacid dehalogenase [Methylomonas sp.]